MSRTSLALLAALALAAAGAPRAASAHGVEAEVDQRAGAVSVRVRYHGAKPLADARYEVESPRGGAAPFAEGRTDRHGWLAFTPDVPGRWTVRVADASGHGKTVEVDVAGASIAAAAATATSPNTIELAPQGPATGTPDSQGGWTGGYAFRVVAGLTVIVLAFRVLLTVQRARRAKGR